MDQVTLYGFERASVSVSVSERPTRSALDGFALVHMAEHLIGRRLLRVPSAVGLNGTARPDCLSVTFVAPKGEFGRALAMSEVDRLTGMRDVTEQDYMEEVGILAVEDKVVPAAARCSADLPMSLDCFLARWNAAGLAVEVARGPVIGPVNGSLLDFTYCPPAAAKGAVPRRHQRYPARAAECSDAYAALRTRIGREPELFLLGGPIESYYNAASIFLAGLSAYTSPMLQKLRRRTAPLYVMKFFEFAWRRSFFVAGVALPAVSRTEFNETIGPAVLASIRGLTVHEIRRASLEGVLACLTNLELARNSGKEIARIQRLGQLNGFDASFRAIAQSVVDRSFEEINRYRWQFHDSMSEELARQKVGV